ncbi:MAG: HAD-IB family hydrolase [Myxococcota bacterium]
MKGVAFFDLDRTLIRENSASLYVRHETAAGRLSKLRLMEAMFYMGLYHFALVRMDLAVRKAIRLYQGDLESELRARTQAWFHREIAPRLLPGARAAIKSHQEAGDAVVLLTGSSWYAAEAARDAWGLDGILANRPLIDAQGILTGDVEEPVCYGAGKVIWAERWAEQHGLSLEGCAFYTDSFTDVPMLERATRAFVVNPDPRLRREAARRGWPILVW